MFNDPQDYLEADREFKRLTMTSSEHSLVSLQDHIVTMKQIILYGTINYEDLTQF